MLAFPCPFKETVWKEGVPMKTETMRCGLTLTDSARKGIIKNSKDELAFFSMQPGFDVHIEKRPENKQGHMSFSIFFDNQTNKALAKTLDNRVAVLECIYKNDGFLATGFHVRGRKEPVRTNRRLAMRMKFQVGQPIAMPIELYTSLRELPIAEDRSEYVKKRLSSWEGYLSIQEKNADVADITARIASATLNQDFSKVKLTCNGLKDQDWKSIRGFSAKMSGQQSDIGNVLNANRSKGVIEIELNQKFKEMARRNEWHPKSFKEVVFSNFAELSQVKRLRKGFKDLQDGLAANANLEKILFEERPVVRISKTHKDLTFHNQLNEFQQEAVTGAMTANDLYVIQGPPGTGKTTVISEICHQNVKAGLRTLVASQANLAVDNALGRLLSHQDIRILRYGRTESIEEEGKKFIEENVALNWKQQTIAAVNEQLQVHSKREAQINEELQQGENKKQQLEEELTQIKQQILLKEQARSTHASCSNELKQLSERLDNLQKTHDELEAEGKLLRKSAEEITVEITRLEQLLQTQAMSTEELQNMEGLEQQIKRQREYLNYRHVSEQIVSTLNLLAQTHQGLEQKRHEKSNARAFLEQLQTISKLENLTSELNRFAIVPPEAIKQQMSELHQHIQSIKTNKSLDTYNEWFELLTRLGKAIGTVENLLKENGFLKEKVLPNCEQRADTVEDINGLITRVGRMIIEPNVKHFLASRSYSSEKYEFLEKMTVGLGVLYQKRNYVHSQIASIEVTKELFLSIKTAMSLHMDQQVLESDQTMKELQQDAERLEVLLEHLRQQSSQLYEAVGDMEETLSVQSVEAALVETEKLYVDYKEMKKVLKESAAEIEQKQGDYQTLIAKLEKNTTAAQQLNVERSEVDVAIEERQNKLVELAEIIAQNPEEQLQVAVASLTALASAAEALVKERVRLPLTQMLQQEWLSMLSDANDYDLDEIRKMYVRHANVIGTTCVASARRDFVEEYPTFDVVIIDEVSKATPPELLLPMLKGKKIILVGDHHQLPPLVGQETMEEFLAESDLQTDKSELKKLLEESLFERLFRTLPKQNKTMLAIQYRMHESIMETITPFYEEGNYKLQCGLVDSDSARDHLMESRFIQRKDHLLWFDMPNEQSYFEEKVKGGTSRYNQSELNMISDLLVDLDEATGSLKRKGVMDQEQRKSVGVISFYGEQVKRIDRLIQQELMPKHLHCRTGSVDKFQGMEMDIIILSFVRNHKDKGGDIGFARDYRRLNVALSRARELLVIVGSSEMFTVRPKDVGTKKMYSRLLEEIKKNNGFRDKTGQLKV